MGYTTVIFDYDGTLVDSQEGIAKGFQQALAAYGIREEVEEIKKLIGPPLSRTIVTKYGFGEEDAKEAMAIFRRYVREHGNEECRVFDGVPEMLRGLREAGLSLAIATNKPESIALPQIRYLGLEPYFSAIMANNDAQDRGSKSDFVRMALEACGGSAAQSLMVGDRRNDIEGGKAVGLDTAGVLYGYGSPEEIRDSAPTYVAATPLEILNLVKNA